jgi:flagellar basal body-associated protein FliL
MKKIVIIIVVVVIGIGGIVAWQLSKTKKTPTTTNRTSTQVLPVNSNPIQNTSQQPGLVITAAAAENNVDPTTKQAIADRLQLSLQNTSSQTMSNLEVYYQMKDTKTGQTEAYHQVLTGLQIAPGETKTVYFDNQSGEGHYPENKYSLYRSSQNEVDFTIQVSAPGFKPVGATAKKSAGTGETAG